MANFRDNPEYINRNGRPRKGECLTDLLKKYGNIKEDGEELSKKDQLTKKMWELALAGDTIIMKYLYDRVDGRPKESIDLDSRGDITYKIIKAKDGKG